MGAAASAKRPPNGESKMNVLFEAIEGGNYIFASQLIFRGANINCINFRGETPLIVTCRTITEKKIGTVKFVKFLIANGANVKQIDILGFTASMHARENGNEEIATFLEKMERKASFLNRKGNSTFSFAAIGPNNGNRYQQYARNTYLSVE